MKHLFLIFSILLSSALLVGCKSSYAPGDYYSLDGDKGVVVSVDADAQPLLIISLDEVSALDADSALRWGLENEAQGWRLPDKDEIALVNKYKTLINRTMEKHHAPLVLVNHTFYWTSSPCSPTHTYACGPDGLNCYFNQNNSHSYRARKVKNLKN